MLIENQLNQKNMVVAEKRRVKNDAKLVVNLKEERERPREEKEDANQ